MSLVINIMLPGFHNLPSNESKYYEQIAHITSSRTKVHGSRKLKCS